MPKYFRCFLRLNINHFPLTKNGVFLFEYTRFEQILFHMYAYVSLCWWYVQCTRSVCHINRWHFIISTVFSNHALLLYFPPKTGKKPLLYFTVYMVPGREEMMLIISFGCPLSMQTLVYAYRRLKWLSWHFNISTLFFSVKIVLL
jgi:hypothetical protein